MVAPADPSIVVDGFQGVAAHPAIRVEETFRFQPEADTFYVVLVRTVTRRAEGLEEGEVVPPALDPIAYDEGGDAWAMAFANPIFVDVDGGGYDRFPLLQALEQGLVPVRKPPVEALAPPVDEAAFHDRLRARVRPTKPSPPPIPRGGLVPVRPLPRRRRCAKTPALCRPSPPSARRSSSPPARWRSSC